MEASGVGGGAEKRPIVDLVKDNYGTDQILLRNPKGASVKVIAFSFFFLIRPFVSPMFTIKFLDAKIRKFSFLGFWKYWIRC